MKLHYNKEFDTFSIVDATKVEYHQTRVHLTRKTKGYLYDPRFKLGIWNGDISLFKEGNKGNFNYGLWREVSDLCKENSWQFIVDNKEEIPTNKDVSLEDLKLFCKDFFEYHRTKKGDIFFPYDHQIESVYKILKYRYCICEIATGGGKSLVFSLILFYLLSRKDNNFKFLLIVPSISLVTQFYNEIIEYNNSSNNENPNPLDIRMCEIMSDKPRVDGLDESTCNVFIGTYQSLEKRPPEFFKQFDVITTDECLHPESMITMADNSLKAIKDIKIGEYVKTVNEETNQIESKPVEYIYKDLSKSEQMYELELENGEYLKITGNHKVRLVSNIWKRIDELTISDEILDLNI